MSGPSDGRWPTDLLIMIPGLLGSRLYLDGRQVWGWRALARGSEAVTRDLLEAAANPDRVTAPGLFSGWAVIPKRLKVAGYRDLAQFCRSMVARGLAKQFAEYPYNWLLSCGENAERLNTVVEAWIAEFERTTKRRPRLTIIAHSMGGVIAARAICERDPEETVSWRFIGLGVPFHGALKARITRETGEASFGPATFDVGALVSRLHSLDGLQPTYPWDVDEANDDPAPTGLDRLTNHAFPFHVVVGRGADTDAFIERGSIISDEGDGTVPRISASPPWWFDDSAAHFTSHNHTAMLSARSVHDHLEGLIGPRRVGRRSSQPSVTVAVPELVEIGAELSIQAVSASPDVSLRYRVVHPYLGNVAEGPLRRDGWLSTHAATTRVNRPGALKIVVESAPGTPSVEPTFDLVLAL